MIRVSGVRALLALAAVALAAPVAVSAQAKDVAGVYNTTLNGPQGPMKVVITVKREAGALGGSLAAEGFPVMPLASVVPTDTALTVRADTPDGPVPVTLRVGAGNAVTGTLVYQGMPMPLEGTFEPAGGAPAAAAAGINAAGVYTIRTEQPLMGDAEFNATCTVTRGANNAFGGVCVSPEHGEAAINSVSVAGNVVTMAGDTPAGPFKITVTVVSGTANGTITIGDEVARMKGTYTAK